jgi:hypothetical protein
MLSVKKNDIKTWLEVSKTCRICFENKRNTFLSNNEDEEEIKLFE